MTSVIRLLRLFIILCTFAAPSRGAEPAPRRDVGGDPLPRHALARLGTLRWRTEQVISLAYSGDGKLLACGYEDLVFFDAHTGRRLGRPLKGRRGLVPEIAFAASGNGLAARYLDGIDWYDAGTGARQASISAQGVTGIVLAPDGKHLVALHESEKVLLHDDTGAIVATFARGGRTAAFGRGGKTLLVGSDKRIRIWDVATKKELRRLEGEARLLAASADGRVVVARARNAIHLWDPIRGMIRRTIAVPDHLLDLRGGENLVLSANGRTVALAGNDHLFAWDCASGRERFRRIDYQWQTALALSPDGRTLAWGVRSSPIIHRVDLPTGRELHPVPGHEDHVESLAFAPDGKRLASGGRDHITHVWSLPAGREVIRWAGGGCIAWSRDGKWLALPHSDDAIALHDAATGRIVRLLAGAPESQGRNAIAFAPDGSRVAVGVSTSGRMSPSEGRVLVWETATGRLEHTFLDHHADPVSAVVLSPEGKYLAVGSSGVRIWDLATRRPVRLIRGVGTPIRALAYATDGRTLIVGSDEVIVWDLAADEEARSFGVAHGGVAGLALSPDGKLLATTGTDGVVRLWDFASGTQRAMLMGHAGRTNAVAFRPDGQVLASAGIDTTILLWDVGAVLRDSPRRPAALTRADLARLWDDLGKADPATGYRAMWALAGEPAGVVAFLRPRLKPKPAVDPARFALLIKQLDDNNFTIRQEALRQLERLGQAAVPALRAVLIRKPPLEVRRRIEGLLARYGSRILRRRPARRCAPRG